MYSIVLFIVETSLSGLSGSGQSPTSAVESTSNTSLVRHASCEGDPIVDAELLGETDELVRAVALAHENELDVVATVTGERRDRAKREVDAVLRPHDPEIGAEVPSP